MCHDLPLFLMLYFLLSSFKSDSLVAVLPFGNFENHDVSYLAEVCDEILAQGNIRNAPLTQRNLQSIGGHDTTNNNKNDCTPITKLYT